MNVVAIDVAPASVAVPEGTWKAAYQVHTMIRSICRTLPTPNEVLENRSALLQRASSLYLPVRSKGQQVDRLFNMAKVHEQILHPCFLNVFRLDCCFSDTCYRSAIIHLRVKRILMCNQLPIPPPHYGPNLHRSLFKQPTIDHGWGDVQREAALILESAACACNTCRKLATTIMYQVGKPPLSFHRSLSLPFACIILLSLLLSISLSCVVRY
jgi:hypothetical protein